MHEDIYFYDSFPPSNDRALGLKVLESILRYGFLLTPEKQVFVQTRNLGEMTIVQKRACFTAIPSREVGAHANVFGPFALEFEPQATLAWKVGNEIRETRFEADISDALILQSGGVAVVVDQGSRASPRS